MANLTSLVKRFDPGKMLGGAISSGVGRFRSNIGSGDQGYRVMMRGYSTIKSFERRFASRDSGKSRPAGPVGGPTRRAAPTAPSAPSGAPARTDHIAAGEEFTHKGNVYIVPEGHVFDTRSGRLIADPATSKSRSFVAFAKAGVIMQSSFDNFKTVTFRKLDKIIDLVGKLQISPVVAAPLEEVKKPEEVGAPEKEKPSNLAGMLSGLGLRYFVRPLVQLFNRIIKWITGLWTAVRKLFTRIANAIIGAFKRFWQFMTKIKNAFMRVVNFVKNLIPKAFQALKDIGKRIGKFFTDKFTAAKDFIVKRLTAVKDYLIKLGVRALAFFGKMIMKVAPFLAPHLKGVAGKAVSAVSAAKAAAPAVAGTAVLAKAGGKALLSALTRVPLVGHLLTVATVIENIEAADKEYDNSRKTGDDKKKHNEKVAKIIVGAIGMTAGAALFGALGAAGGGALGTLGLPVVGTFVGGLVGGLVGSIGGAFFGESAFLEILDRTGGAEELGKLINDMLSKQPVSETDVELLKTLTDDIENAKKDGKARDQVEEKIRKLHKNKHITKDEFKHFIRMIKQQPPANAPLTPRSPTAPTTPSPVVFSGASGGMSGDLVPGAQIGERIAGDRVGPKATPRVIDGDAPPAPPAAPAAPPAAPPAAAPSSVQPVPPQTPPASDEQRDEFGNIVIINSQTNTNHTTNVSVPSATSAASRSPNPFDRFFA